MSLIWIAATHESDLIKTILQKATVAAPSPHQSYN
jgi:hypothetical protein